MTINQAIALLEILERRAEANRSKVAEINLVDIDRLRRLLANLGTWMNPSEPARRAQIEKWHARRLNRARQKRFVARLDEALVQETIRVCGVQRNRRHRKKDFDDE